MRKRLYTENWKRRSWGQEKEKSNESGLRKKTEERRRERGEKGLFCEVTGYGVAGRTRLSCVGRYWRKAQWKAGKRKVFGKGGERDLGVDSV